jgi:hypothetical protein
MTSPERPRKPCRLNTPPKIKPLPRGKPLAPYHVPAPLPGKFQDVPGQAAMDFTSDEWDALTEEESA